MSHYVYYAVFLMPKNIHEGHDIWTWCRKNKGYPGYGPKHENFEKYMGPFKTRRAAEFYANNVAFCSGMDIPGIEEYARNALGNWLMRKDHPIVVSWAGYRKRITMHDTPINKRTIAKVMTRECFVPLSRDSEFTYWRDLVAG